MVDVPRGDPEKGPFTHADGTDPNFARFVGKVVRDFGVTEDAVSNNLNTRYTSDTFSDPEYQREPADPFKGIIDHRNKPAA